MVLGLLARRPASTPGATPRRDPDLAVRLQVAEAMWRLGETTASSRWSPARSACTPTTDDGVMGLAAGGDRAGDRAPARVADHRLRGDQPRRRPRDGQAGLGRGLRRGPAGAKSREPKIRLLAALALGAIGRSDAQDELATAASAAPTPTPASPPRRRQSSSSSEHGLAHSAAWSLQRPATRTEHLPRERSSVLSEVYRPSGAREKLDRMRSITMARAIAGRGTDLAGLDPTSAESRLPPRDMLAAPCRTPCGHREVQGACLESPHQVVRRPPGDPLHCADRGGGRLRQQGRRTTAEFELGEDDRAGGAVRGDAAVAAMNAATSNANDIQPRMNAQATQLNNNLTTAQQQIANLNVQLAKANTSNATQVLRDHAAHRRAQGRHRHDGEPEHDRRPAPRASDKAVSRRPSEPAHLRAGQHASGHRGRAAQPRRAARRGEQQNHAAGPAQ